MPFQRATLTVLRDYALQDIGAQQIYDSTTGQLADVSMLVHSPLRVIAYATAGGVYSGYGYLDWIALQATPWNATGEFAAGWGALKNTFQKPATFAQGAEVIFGPVEADIPAGTVLSRTDGVTYVTAVDATIGAGGSVAIAFQAQATGAAGNAAAGITLNFSTPIQGLNPSLVTANPITGGADIEDPEAFKARYLQAFAQPAAGGSKTDWIGWAEAVPGVTRAWCVPDGGGPGSVVIYTMWDQANAAWGGFPQGTNGVSTADQRDAAAQGDQLTVANAIEPDRPVTALAYSCAPIAQPIDFVLGSLGTAANAVNQAAAKAALTALFLAIGDPTGVTLYPSSWEGVLANVPGLTQYTLASPVGPVECAIGFLAICGTVTLTP